MAFPSSKDWRTKAAAARGSANKATTAAMKKQLLEIAIIYDSAAVSAKQREFAVRMGKRARGGKSRPALASK